MGAESHNACQASSNEPAALSAAELEAMEILADYGIDFSPVYIGRARPYLNCGAYDSKDPRASAPVTSKSAQEIVDYVIELIKLDEDQRKFLERAEEEKAIAVLRDRLTLSEPDRIATQDLTNAIRELVDYERAKRSIRTLDFSPDLVRASLYPNSESKECDPCYLAKIKIFGREVIARAWPNKDFVNLELEVR